MHVFLVMSFLLLTCSLKSDSIESLTQHIDKHPDDWEAHFYLANKFCEQNCFETAIAHYNQALTHNPPSLEALYNKAYALKQLGSMREAAPCYEQVLQNNPNHSNAHQGLGQAYLAVGDLQRGFYEYQWRLIDVDTWKQKPIDLTQLQGKTVLIRAEMGFGDTMQFIRYAQLLKNYGATVFVQTYKELIPLFSLCDYIDKLIPIDQPLPKADRHIPLMSLPVTADTTLETIPANIPYLYADPTLTDYWQQQLAHDTNFKIGICWQSKPNLFLEHNPLTKRSVPLALFAPLSRIPGVEIGDICRDSL